MDSVGVFWIGCVQNCSVACPRSSGVHHNQIHLSLGACCCTARRISRGHTGGYRTTFPCPTFLRCCLRMNVGRNGFATPAKRSSSTARCDSCRRAQPNSTVVDQKRSPSIDPGATLTAILSVVLNKTTSHSSRKLCRHSEVLPRTTGTACLLSTKTCRLFTPIYECELNLTKL